MDKLNIDLNIDDSNFDAENYKKEVYQKILNDSEFYSSLINRGFSNEDIMNEISLFNRIYHDFQISKNLLTYEDCVRANKYSRLIAIKNGKNIETRSEILEPVKEEVKYFKRFIIKDFQQEFNRLTWNKIDKSTVKANISEAIKSKQNSFYLYGEHSTGKTYKAIALVNTYLAKNVDFKAAFINTNTCFKELSSMIFSKELQDDFNKRIEELSQVDVLVFDDFGSEYKNEAIRDYILFPILKYRYTHKNELKTIFTSNYTIEEVAKMYSNVKKGSENNQIGSLLKVLVKKEIFTGSEPLY